MPELAEVYYFSHRWDAGIGHKVARVLVHEQKRVFKDGIGKRLPELLKGRKLLTAEAHGKQMMFGFEGGMWLGVHLGMTGQLSCEAAGYEPQKHDHLVLEQKERTLVFQDPRLFGVIRLDETGSGGNPPGWWSALPPRIDSAEFTVDLVAKALERRGKTPLKSLLLDQAHFPGIGNWMADEVPWQARLPAAMKAGDLTAAETRRLHEVLRSVCAVSLETIGTDFSDPPAGWLFHQRWSDKGICPQTGQPLTRETLGGRTTCSSPAWQNRPARFDFEPHLYQAPLHTPEKAKSKRPATETPLKKAVQAKSTKGE